MHTVSTYILIVILLVMNFADMAHAECGEGTLCASIQTSASEDHADGKNQDTDQEQAACDCCASGHHHHSHVSVSNSKADPLSASSQTDHIWDDASYLSQLNPPPFQPPKA
jgi:hypothetical protein